MFWDVLRASFEDELQKIAEFSLDGLKPQTAVAGAAPRPPMPSAAYESAQAILDRRDSIHKEAANLQFTPAITQNRPPDQSQTSQPVREVKSLGAHALGGAGIGRLAAEMSFKPGRMAPDPAKMHGRKWYLTAAGAGLGAAEYARKKLQQKDKEKQSSFSPAQSLKASKQVGGFTSKIHSTPSTHSQTPGKIGRKFAQ